MSPPAKRKPDNNPDTGPSKKVNAVPPWYKQCGGYDFELSDDYIDTIPPFHVLTSRSATSLPLYQLVGFDNAEAAAARFVYIGADDPSHQYILAKDFRRLAMEENLSEFWNILNGGSFATMSSWDASAMWDSRVPYFVISHLSNSSESEKAWTKRQKSVTQSLLARLKALPAREAPKHGDNPRLLRYQDLSELENLKIIIVPSEYTSDLTSEEIRACFDEHKRNGEIPSGCNFMPSIPTKDKFVYLSSSPFRWYHTFISEADAFVLPDKLQLVQFQRPFPDKTVAEKVHSTLREKLEAQPSAVRLTKAKMELAGRAGTRDDVKGQQAVMGTSATRFAEQFGWKDLGIRKTAKGKPIPDSEWLHRIGFRFGGLGEKARSGFSDVQSTANLVFGTRECNTHMLRFEDAIADVVQAYGIELAHNAVLRTKVINSGHIDLRFNRDTTMLEIPSWMKVHKYSWLSPGLEYEFLFNAQNGPNFNASWQFNTFSQYYPFKFERSLDMKLFKTVFEKFKAPTAVTTTLLQSTSRTSAGGRSGLVQSGGGSLPVPRVSASLSARVDVSGPGSLQTQVSESLQGRALALSGRGRNPNKVLSSTARPPDHDDTSTSIQSRSLAISQKTTTAMKATTSAHVKAGAYEPSHAVSYMAAMGPNTRPVPDEDTGATPLDSFAVQPPSTSKYMENFTFVADIPLFGIPSLKAELYTWSGSVPDDVIIGLHEPTYEKAVLAGEVRLSTIIPKLKETPFDAIPFRNVTFTFQNYRFDSTKALGWHIDADIVINESCGALHDVLRIVLGVQEPTLHMHAGLGGGQSWSMPLRLSSFTLDGTFADLRVSICDELTLTSIGIQLMGIGYMKQTAQPEEGMKYGFAVFGSMALRVPQSPVPLELHYQISEMSGLVCLHADLIGDIWQDALGVKGLRLSNLSVSATLDIALPLRSFGFNVLASFNHASTSAVFEGTFAAGGACTLSATLSNFSFDSLYDLFEALTGESLSHPTELFVAELANITIGSVAGLTISLQNAKISQFLAPNASLTVSTAGVTLSGDITSSQVIRFGDVVLNKASLLVSFGKWRNSRTANILLGGEITIGVLTVQASVHLYEDTMGPQWTVFSQLTLPGKTLALSSFVPAVKQTFLDMQLERVTFCAASRDDPLMEAFTVPAAPYGYHQGVQVCAVIGTLDAMTPLLRSPANNFILTALWSKDVGFTVEIKAPTSTIVQLGHGISTEPFTLRVQTSGSSPSLLLSTGVKVPVAHSNTPLGFQLALNVDAVGARGSAEMNGYWINPMGLGNNVRIGPFVALSIEIIFAQFISTGTPSGFGIAGSLQIGKVSANVALSISDNPLHELMSGEVRELDVQDLVAFANLVTGLRIQQPDNFLQFRNVKLYVCPAGIMLGTKTYPRGFSFDASTVIFGKVAEIGGNVNPSGATLKGSLDGFKLGPLELRGTDGPKALLDVELGSSAQHVIIDGMATFFDSDVLVKVTIVVLPKAEFNFATRLRFTDLLLFNLTAVLVGQVSFTPLHDRDFVFDALMNQRILEYVADELNKKFNLAKQEADKALLVADAAVTQARKDLQEHIVAAQREVGKTSVAWKNTRDSVTRQNQQIIDQYTKLLSDRQKELDDLQKKYMQAMNDAQTGLSAAQRNRENALSSARLAVSRAEQAMESSISDASRAVRNANADLEREVGNVENSIRSARNEVNSLQSQIDRVQRDINNLNNLPWYNPGRAQIVPLGAQLGTLSAAKFAADKVLEAAQALVHGAGYAACKATLESAQIAESSARTVGRESVRGAQTALDGVDASTRATVQAAQAVVDAVGKSAAGLAYQKAKEALETFKRSNRTALEAANKAIKDLGNCTEKLAFDAAQTALDGARGAFEAFNAGNAVIGVAKDGGGLAINIGKWAVHHAFNIVQIQKIHLSGSLRSMTVGTGKVEKPLTAHVDGMVVGQSFTFDGTFEPGKAEEFISSIFEKIWNDIKFGALRLLD